MEVIWQTGLFSFCLRISMLIWPFEFFFHPLSNNEKLINAVEAHLVDSLMNLSKRPANAMRTKKKKNECTDSLCVCFASLQSHMKQTKAIKRKSLILSHAYLKKTLTNHKYWSRAVFCPTDDYWGVNMQGFLFKTTEGSQPIQSKSINQLMSNFTNKKNILMGSRVISSRVCGDEIRYFKLYRDSGRST